MPNGESPEETYTPPRPHRSSESNLRDYLEARLDELEEIHNHDATAARDLGSERDRRLDDRFKAQETATSAALAAAEKAVTAALTASEKAITKAEIAQQKVNEGQNEFRATLKDQAATLMPRAETELVVRELRAIISAQLAEIGAVRTRLDIGPPSLGALQSRSDEQVGRTAGSLDTRSLIFALIGASGVILGAVAFLTR